MARRKSEKDGVVVGAVAARGPAQRGGLRPGDRIVAINGQPVRDVIDFHFNAGEARLTCAVEREGARVCALIPVERDRECVAVRLPDANDHGSAGHGQRTHVLPVLGEQVDKVRRQAPEHTHREIEAIRGRNWHVVP